jgi:hypothetical protein
MEIEAKEEEEENEIERVKLLKVSNNRVIVEKLYIYQKGRHKGAKPR